MDALKNEIIRQIEDNNKYIEDHYIYDFDYIETYIDELFVDGEVKFDNLSFLSSIDYFDFDFNRLYEICDDYTRLERIIQLLKKGLGNVDINVYTEIMSGSSNNFQNFINDYGLSQTQIECMISSLKGNDTGIDNQWMKGYIEKVTELLTKKSNHIINEIKECINFLKNKISILKYQEYIISNNSHNRNVKTQDIYRQIQEKRDKNIYLSNLIDEIYSDDLIKPCKNYESFDKILNFIEGSSLSENDKISIIINLYSINKAHLDTIIRQSPENIEQRIDANANEVMSELLEQNEDRVSSEHDQIETNLEPITMSYIISQESIEQLELTEEELKKFNHVKNGIIKYISNTIINTSVLADDDNIYLLNEMINNNMNLDDIIVDGSNRLEWELIIIYLNKYQHDKSMVIDVINIIDKVLTDQEQLVEKAKKLDERLDEIYNIETDINDFIHELTSNYLPYLEDDYNNLVIRLSNFKLIIDNINDDVLYNDQEYEKIMKEFDELELLFNQFYNNNSYSEEPDTIEDFDINKDNYIIFDESVKKQLSKYDEKFYIQQIIYTIQFLRSKEKMGNISKESSVHVMNGSVKDIASVKSKKIRLYYVKVNNDTYYVSGVMKKKRERSKIVTERMEIFSEIGNRNATQLKVDFKTMTRRQIHDMCEQSYQETMDILNHKMNNKKGSQLGGAIDGID